MTAAAKLPPCPICGKPSDPRLKPFCSERCSDIDLGRWLSDRYVIPGSDDTEEDDLRSSRNTERD